MSDFLAYPDHGVIYRFIPRAVDRTEMEVLLVDEAAVEGTDYDVERLTWLWKSTSAEDKKIVEMNQAGVNSRFFEPGPYSMQEPFADRFVSWYLQELSSSPNRPRRRSDQLRGRSIIVIIVPLAVAMSVVVALAVAVAVPVLLTVLALVSRHVLVVVPIVAHEIDRAATGVVLRAVLAPVLLVAGGTCR